MAVRRDEHRVRSTVVVLPGIQGARMDLREDLQREAAAHVLRLSRPVTSVSLGLGFTPRVTV